MGLTAHARPRPGAAAAPNFLRRSAPVALLGLAGVMALLLQPLPPDLRARVPALAEAPPIALQALLVLNPALTVIVSAALGAVLAHRVGLGSLVAGTAVPRAWARTLARCAASGYALGLGLAATDVLLRPHLGQAWLRLVAERRLEAPDLATGMLYGGLAEEVMLRWGAMSLVAWALASLPWLRDPRRAMAAAIVVAAGLFAAGHLPALAAQVEWSTPVVARTLLLNGAAGLLYGWLFWRHHLEAAMAAHAATHLGLRTWHGLAG